MASGLVALVVVLLAGLVGSISFFIIDTLRSSEPCRIAVESAKRDRKVIERLGTPIKEGWLTTGSVSYRNSLGLAKVTIPISGPHGSAKIYLVASKAGGKWTFSRLVCQLDGTGEQFPLSPNPATSLQGTWNGNACVTGETYRINRKNDGTFIERLDFSRAAVPHDPVVILSTGRWSVNGFDSVYNYTDSTDPDRIGAQRVRRLTSISPGELRYNENSEYPIQEFRAPTDATLSRRIHR